MAVIRKALALLCLAVLLFTALTASLPALIVDTDELAVPTASETLHPSTDVAHQPVSLLAFALLRAPPFRCSLP